jgi:polysaccharide export outer membrane protein
MADMPVQTVDSAGQITLPYLGPIRVAGRTPREVEAEILQKLGAKAVNPQVVVSILQRSGGYVSVSGDVNRPNAVPLMTGRERLLDMIAHAGGTTAPAYESFVELSRGTTSRVVLLSDVIANPRQNFPVAPRDTITVKAVPRAYTALGATTVPSEIPFKVESISLAQAVARARGLSDSRADPAAIYVFRYEEPQIAARLKALNVPQKSTTKLVPVIYHADFRDPRTLFNIQEFKIEHGDLVYVANAEAAQLTKLLRLLSSSVGLLANADGLASQ